MYFSSLYHVLTLLLSFCGTVLLCLQQMQRNDVFFAVHMCNTYSLYTCHHSWIIETNNEVVQRVKRAVYTVYHQFTRFNNKGVLRLCLVCVVFYYLAQLSSNGRCWEVFNFNSSENRPHFSTQLLLHLLTVYYVQFLLCTLQQNVWPGLLSNHNTTQPRASD